LLFSSGEPKPGSLVQLIAPGLPQLPAPNDYIRAALADTSRRAYQTDLVHFLNWGGRIPAAPQVVAEYLSGFGGKLAASTLNRRMVAIGRAHTAQGLQNPCKSDLVRVVLRGIRRTHGAAQKRVQAAEAPLVTEMVRNLPGVSGLRDRALLLLGFAGAFRRSELVALTVDDLQFVDQGLIVRLRRSKTDQEGQGRNVAIPHARGSACPVKAVREWLDATGISTGKVFRSVSLKCRVSDAGLTAQSVALIIKRHAKRVGADPENFSGHSLRAGLATSAAKAGVTAYKIRARPDRPHVGRDAATIHPGCGIVRWQCGGSSAVTVTRCLKSVTLDDTKREIDILDYNVRR
jgi:site-specific recombinase XerD